MAKKEAAFRFLFFKGHKFHCEGPSPLMTSSNPNYLPKASSPNSITLGVRILIHEFWGNSLHTIACRITL
jgi:hypothetical protein